MKIVKTIFCHNKMASCLICNTTYRAGESIIPLPSCKCGNIPFFDVTVHQVRCSVSWEYVKVDCKNNWQHVVLEQIKQFGKPKHVIKFKTEEEKIDYSLSLLLHPHDIHFETSRKDGFNYFDD